MSELTLRNPQLAGVDPFSSELTREQQKQIAEEARINPAFFFPIVDKANIKGNSIPSYFFKQMIKPCLCCGSLGELKESESGDKISNQVQCTNMGCMLNNYNTWYCNEWDAINEWNGTKEELQRTQLKNTLFESGVLIHTPEEYLIVRELYLLAGANIWPWHRGYKFPEESDSPVGYYTWQECGFFKELYPVVGTDTLYTVSELFNIVNSYIDNTALNSGYLMVKHYQSLKELVQSLTTATLPQNFIEVVPILNLDIAFLKLIYESSHSYLLLEYWSFLIQIRKERNLPIHPLLTTPSAVFSLIYESKMSISINKYLDEYFKEIDITLEFDIILIHLKSICLTDSILEIRNCILKYKDNLEPDLSTERCKFLNELIEVKLQPTLTAVKEG